jgi:hypothetical protein
MLYQPGATGTLKLQLSDANGLAFLREACFEGHWSRFVLLFGAPGGNVLGTGTWISWGGLSESICRSDLTRKDYDYGRQLRSHPCRGHV